MNRGRLIMLLSTTAGLAAMTWQDLSPMPAGVAGGFCARVNGKIVYAGGRRGPTASSSGCEQGGSTIPSARPGKLGRNYPNLWLMAAGQRQSWNADGQTEFPGKCGICRPPAFARA